jgi:hypothetical protein
MTNMKNVLVYCKSVTLPQTLFLPPPICIKIIKKKHVYYSFRKISALKVAFLGVEVQLKSKLPNF